MSLNIEKRTTSDVAILDLEGKILLDNDLYDAVNALVTGGQTKIVLNVAEVSHVDSAGLGDVVRSFTTVLRKGGHLKLLSPSKRFRHLLTVTGLIKMFAIFENEDKAVRSYSMRRTSSPAQT